MENKLAQRRANVTEPLPRAGKVSCSKDETRRLRALGDYQILDTEPEEVFDELTRSAAQVSGCPIAGISFMDQNRHWFKSRVGVTVSETPRKLMVRSASATSTKPLIIEDTRQSKRAGDLPLADDSNIRFYVGVPLINQAGFILGTLCVLDRKPHHLSQEQAAALETLSRQIITQMELRRALIERQMAEAEIHRLNQVLERKVEERTAQLDNAYQSLKGEIEDRVQTQDQMMQIEKVEAVGRLAGGIAHDFNNILLVINGYSDMLAKGTAPSESRSEFVSEIQKAGKRGATMTRQLLGFSRRQAIEPRVFDLNETVDGMTGMLKRLIGQHIQFEARKEMSPQLVHADTGQMEQVIMNLVINACDAMHEGGSLVLKTSSCMVSEAVTYEGGEIRPGCYTMLTVRDSGMGMTPEIKARIYEPFFTTKPEGKGTGLGLATCFSIVREAVGHITCETAPGQGTTFRVFLPTPQARKNGSMTMRLPVAAPRGKETILLVEDDESVCKLTSLMLSSFGYKVIETASGPEALELIQGGAGTKFDLLLSDLNMPNMTGRELAERILSLDPEAKCVLMSGNADDGVVIPGFQATPFLQKPFTPDQLSKTVRETLDQVA